MEYCRSVYGKLFLIYKQETLFVHCIMTRRLKFYSKVQESVSLLYWKVEGVSVQLPENSLVEFELEFACKEGSKSWYFYIMIIIFLKLASGYVKVLTVSYSTGDCILRCTTVTQTSNRNIYELVLPNIWSETLIKLKTM